MILKQPSYNINKQTAILPVHAVMTVSPHNFSFLVQGQKCILSAKHTKCINCPSDIAR